MPIRLAFLGLLLVALPALAAEPLVVAHRGASKHAPENTLPAFALAWKQGADAIEGDFHLTSDGHIVCLHDYDTARVAGRKLVVKETPLAELRQLDVGRWRGEEFAGTTIPTLAEVLAIVPAGKRVYVEVKCGPEIVEPLLPALKRSGLKDEQIVIIAFNAKVIAAMKQAAPQYKGYWLSSLRRDGSEVVRPSPEEAVATLKQIQADGLSTSHPLADEAYVRGIQQAGYEYHVWTVDDAAAAGRFRAWGAGSITTNVPGLIREHLFPPDPAR